MTATGGVGRRGIAVLAALWLVAIAASADPLAPGATARYASTRDAAWALFDVADGASIRFASGAGWSQGGLPDFQSWQRYLYDYSLRWSHPVQVRWPAAHH